MANLVPGVETLHGDVHHHDPDAFTVSVNEFCDRGASWSTLRLACVAVVACRPEGARRPAVHDRAVREAVEKRLRVSVPSTTTGWSGRSASCAVGTSTTSHTPGAPLLWVNISLTDSAMHEGGPHSEIARASLIDTDGRIGAVLDSSLKKRGVFDRTAFCILADHMSRRSVVHRRLGHRAGRGGAG